MRYGVAFAAFGMIFIFSAPLFADNEAADIGGSEVLSDLNISDLREESPRPDRFSRNSSSNKSQWDGRDPFFIPGTNKGGSAPPEKGEFQLTAIIYGEGEGVAIINGTILREGDSIRGLRVKKIQKDRVLLVGGVQTVELKVRRFVVE